MNEWRLQEELATRWGREPFRLGSLRVQLLAWEVMTPSWQTNDSTSRWNEPSVDFLGLSTGGNLVAIEIKRRWGGRVSLAQAAGQAIASAARVSQTVTADRLQSAYDAARRGAKERTPLPGPASLTAYFAAFAEGMVLDDVLAAPVVPVVAIAASSPQHAPASLGIEEVEEVLAGSVQRESLRMRTRLARAVSDRAVEVPTHAVLVSISAV